MDFNMISTTFGSVMAFINAFQKDYPNAFIAISVALTVVVILGVIIVGVNMAAKNGAEKNKTLTDELSRKFASDIALVKKTYGDDSITKPSVAAPALGSGKEDEDPELTFIPSSRLTEALELTTVDGFRYKLLDWADANESNAEDRVFLWEVANTIKFEGLCKPFLEKFLSMFPQFQILDANYVFTTNADGSFLMRDSLNDTEITVFNKEKKEKKEFTMSEIKKIAEGATNTYSGI